MTLTHRKQYDLPAREDRVVSEVWNDISVGDPVKITGESGRFHFISHTLTLAGQEWVTVYGGPKGRGSTRSFRPDRVRMIRSRRRT